MEINFIKNNYIGYEIINENNQSIGNITYDGIIYITDSNILNNKKRLYEINKKANDFLNNFERSDINKLKMEYENSFELIDEYNEKFSSYIIYDKNKKEIVASINDKREVNLYNNFIPDKCKKRIYRYALVENNYLSNSGNFYKKILNLNLNNNQINEVINMVIEGFDIAEAINLAEKFKEKELFLLRLFKKYCLNETQYNYLYKKLNVLEPETVYGILMLMVNEKDYNLLENYINERQLNKIIKFLLLDITNIFEEGKDILNQEKRVIEEYIISILFTKFNIKFFNYYDRIQIYNDYPKIVTLNKFNNKDLDIKELKEDDLHIKSINIKGQDICIKNQVIAHLCPNGQKILNVKSDIKGIEFLNFILNEYIKKVDDYFYDFSQKNKIKIEKIADSTYFYFQENDLKYTVALIENQRLFIENLSLSNSIKKQIIEYWLFSEDGIFTTNKIFLKPENRNFIIDKLLKNSTIKNLKNVFNYSYNVDDMEALYNLTNSNATQESINDYILNIKKKFIFTHEDINVLYNQINFEEDFNKLYKCNLENYSIIIKDKNIVKFDENLLIKLKNILKEDDYNAIYKILKKYINEKGEFNNNE